MDRGRPQRLWQDSAYGRSDVAEFDGSVWIINPDLLTARLRACEGLGRDEANLAAVSRIETWLDASIDVHQTIGVETVLSTPKYRRLVTKAKGARLRDQARLCLCRHAGTAA
jgi:predicted ABC-type ATPase